MNDLVIVSKSEIECCIDSCTEVDGKPFDFFDLDKVRKILDKATPVSGKLDADKKCEYCSCVISNFYSGVCSKGTKCCNEKHTPQPAITEDKIAASMIAELQAENQMMREALSVFPESTRVCLKAAGYFGLADWINELKKAQSTTPRLIEVGELDTNLSPIHVNTTISFSTSPKGIYKLYTIQKGE